MLNSQPNPTQAKKDWRYWRAERYRLQAIARKWYIEEGQKQNLFYPENFHKTAKCLYTRIKDHVEIHKNQQNQAFYQNLVRCGRIWTCPVCAPKIQAQRREEIKKFVAWAWDVGKCIMITLTFPHYSHQIAGDLLLRFSKALKYFKGGRSYHNFCKKANLQGATRGLEVNFGINGWHIHTHDLLAVSRNFYPDDHLLFLTNRWREAVEHNGLLPKDKKPDFLIHGLDLKDNTHDAEYLAKLSWGIEFEVTCTHRKHTNTESLTPFQLLDAGKRETWLEFSYTFSGKRQLFWSHGLKEKVGITETSDEKIAEKESKSDCLGLLSWQDWIKIVKHDARIIVLELAEKEGIFGVRSYLECLV